MPRPHLQPSLHSRAFPNTNPSSTTYTAPNPAIDKVAAWFGGCVAFNAQTIMIFYYRTTELIRVGRNLRQADTIGRRNRGHRALSCNASGLALSMRTTRRQFHSRRKRHGRGDNSDRHATAYRGHARDARHRDPQVVGEAPIHTGKVKLDIPPLVENGNTVPMTVSVASPMTADDYVKSIHVFNEKNPQPNHRQFLSRAARRPRHGLDPDPARRHPEGRRGRPPLR